MRKLAGTLAAGAALAVIPACAQAGTEASHPPVVYSFDNAVGWHHAQVRPARGSIEQGGLQLKDLKYRRWTPAGLTKSGRVWDSGVWGKGSVKFFGVKHHAGRKYYAEARITETVTNPSGQSATSVYCVAFGLNNGSKVPEWYAAAGNTEKGCSGS